MITRNRERDREGGTGQEKGGKGSRSMSNGEREDRILANILKEIARRVFHSAELKLGAQAGRGN